LIRELFLVLALGAGCLMLGEALRHEAAPVANALKAAERHASRMEFLRAQGPDGREFKIDPSSRRLVAFGNASKVSQWLPGLRRVAAFGLPTYAVCADVSSACAAVAAGSEIAILTFAEPKYLPALLALGRGDGWVYRDSRFGERRLSLDPNSTDEIEEWLRSLPN
jgi:hypothetical protein